MLSVLRRKRNSPIIAFLLGAIIIVFVAFFGNSWQSCSGGGFYAAKVNGDVITDQESSASYSAEYRNRQARDSKFDRTRAQKENLREQVLNRLITMKILAQKAEDRGLAVDDEALRQAIVENPAFQTDGRFDKKLYEARLNMQQMTDFRFEQQLREELLAQKLAAVAESSITVSTEEARESFMQERRRVNLEFVSIKKQPYEAKVGTITPADAEEWLKKDGSEDEVKKYYTKHSRTKYNVPKQICARHILVRGEKGMPPDLYQEAKKKIIDARKAVAGGMDFAAAAKKFSDDSTKDRGGDLGCFGKGQMVPEFENAAFSLKKGELSSVVESTFGFHIIEVTGEKAAIERKLEDVKSEIALEILAGVKAGELAKKRAEELAEKAKTAATLQEAVTALGAGDPAPLKVEETGPFPQREFIPRIGLSKEISQAAWALTKEAPAASKPFETDNAWVVIRLHERLEPTLEEFEKDKAMTMLSLSYQKRAAVVKEWTEHLRKGANIEYHPLALSYDDDARAQARGRAN